MNSKALPKGQCGCLAKLCTKPYSSISVSYSQREWEKACTEWARAENLLSLSVRSTRHPPSHEHATTKCDATKNRPIVTESSSINTLIYLFLNKEQSIPKMVEILYASLRNGKYVGWLFLVGATWHTLKISVKKEPHHLLAYREAWLMVDVGRAQHTVGGATYTWVV